MRGNFFIFIISLLILLFKVSNLAAQTNTDCLKEVIDLEEKVNFRNDTSLKDKTVFISYSVKTTDWEGQIVVSNIKIYKNEEFMNFFSEQANIYQDTKEVVMIVPQQKIAIINSTNKSLNNYKANDAFFEMRRSFLDSCKIVKCDKASAKKTLELKVNKANRSGNIIGMIYEYDTDAGKILNVKINYNENYKLKQIQIFYKELNINADYKFYASRKYLLGKNGKVLPKLSGYEIVDNRDQSKKTKTK